MVGRAIEVLRAVARFQRSGATLSKVTNVTELSRSTVFRLLRYLTEERLLVFSDEQRCYFIGPLAYELGLAARGHADVASRWRARVEQIAAETGKTAYLVARSDTEVVCLATAQGCEIIRAVTLEVGQRLPLGVGAGSLALLAAMPDDEIEAIVTSNRSKLRFFGGGRLTPKVLEERVQVTRAKGYALSKDSVAKGVIGLGIAVSGESEAIELAVSVSMVATQLDSADQTQIVKTIRRIAHMKAPPGGDSPFLREGLGSISPAFGG